MKYCTKCGAPVSENAKFCNKCGNPVSNLNNEKKNTSDNIEEKKDIQNNENKAEEKSYNTQLDMHKVNENSLHDNIKDRADEIDDTMKIDMNSETIRGAQKEFNNINNNSNNKRYDNPVKNRSVQKRSNNKKSIFSGVIPKVIIGVVVAAVILCGVFFNKISARYYMMKCNDAVNSEEKITCAAKAVKADNNNDTMELLKNTIIDLSKNNLDLAEEKLKELSSILTQTDIKNISIAIKEKKVETLCGSSNYEEALNEFDELDKLGVDFKKNKHYDDVMINVAAKLTGCQAKGNKNALMEDEAVCYDNFDDDVFDEIVEVKEGRKYDNYLKVNLYKFSDGKYKLIDSKTINTAENKGIQGVYEYEEGHKGVYISYESTAGRTFGTSVYGVDDSRLVLKGIVYGNNYTKPDDTNNDGIYEVVSSSTSYASYLGKEVVKSYSIHDDGRTPSEMSDNSTGGNDNKSSDYILPNSDKAYLTEEDLSGLSKEKLALARNEIFARHGYVFKEEPFKSYFEGKSWYSKNPDFDGSDSGLNDYEIANYKVIQNWEKK
ncbi:MAG: YARHG domain-containing protein [Clostridium sp.]|nr:YARHG domain-containing protein [Clostridium sp.]